MNPSTAESSVGPPVCWAVPGTTMTSTSVSPHPDPSTLRKAASAVKPLNLIWETVAPAAYAGTARPSATSAASRNLFIRFYLLHAMRDFLRSAPSDAGSPHGGMSRSLLNAGEWRLG